MSYESFNLLTHKLKKPFMLERNFSRGIVQPRRPRGAISRTLNDLIEQSPVTLSAILRRARDHPGGWDATLAHGRRTSFSMRFTKAYLTLVGCSMSTYFGSACYCLLSNSSLQHFIFLSTT